MLTVLLFALVTIATLLFSLIATPLGKSPSMPIVATLVPASRSMTETVFCPRLATTTVGRWMRPGPLPSPPSSQVGVLSRQESAWPSEDRDVGEGPSQSRPCTAPPRPLLPMGALFFFGAARAAAAGAATAPMVPAARDVR